MATTYLERYRNGERDAVWAELTALGAAIRDDPLYADARAVALETMTRARTNVALLVERLTTLGYRFVSDVLGAPPTPWVPPTTHSLADLRAFEQQHGPLPLSLHAWYEVVGAVDFMGRHPRLSYYSDFEEGAVNMMFMGMPISLSTPPQPVVGMGYQGPDADPLVLWPCEEANEVMPLGAMAPASPGAGPEPRYAFALAPDTIHKTGESGGDPTMIYLPDPAMDAPLHGDWEGSLLVPYLRTCFAWGGFPGLREADEPPRAELAFLTEHLLPL